MKNGKGIAGEPGVDRDLARHIGNLYLLLYPPEEGQNKGITTVPALKKNYAPQTKGQAIEDLNHIRLGLQYTLLDRDAYRRDVEDLKKKLDKNA